MNDQSPVHTDDLQLLLATLPHPLRERMEDLPHADLVEVVLDVGRPAQARYPDRAVDLTSGAVTREHIDRVVASVGEFSADNRAGIEGTLHRISAIRNRQGRIIGLTLRAGRAVYGTVEPIRDLVESGKGVLLLGRPGVGKTTMLREVARILADDLNKRVVVIDTSNEIAGDGDVPHPGIGRARRMQVPHPDQQHAVMIEAVENHMPEVIVIDEIGTREEATAARTIAERGVQLIGTAHGNTLENLVANPTLADLVGGVKTVTLGDEEARFRGTQKTVTERRGPPTFESVVELPSRHEMLVHPDTARSVDELLRGVHPRPQRRTAAPHGQPAEEEQAPPFAPGPSAEVPESKEASAAPEPPGPRAAAPAREPAPGPLGADGPVRIYPYALSRDHVERVIRDLRLDARTVDRPERANLVIARRARAEDPRLQRVLDATGAPLHVVKKNTTAQIRRLLEKVFTVLHGLEDEEVSDAVREAEDAAWRVLTEGEPIELAPHSGKVRQVQHEVAVRYHLVAESVGSEPLRHLVIHPA
ncbi:Stage III sporulation protein SpoIIIAA [Thiohalorhabdus denitrificans]|uniref:Stage III sporulation protein SpoIIIAA n=2 Tax=Thiohalorhabdus denitrificans TaxID=381306 RepID=A0A1G5BTK6_9GAMM|nr:R3H domain-containing nucleic acid-binding protein [Thiohalorhabdus denitrificans]SCX93384.1 Stage III sporulation protein SpoIIIAA [Thiohalorhabdus denitrificans]